jgi:hypothetical protein
MIVSTTCPVEGLRMVNDRGNATAAAIPSAVAAYGLAAIPLKESEC